MGISEIAIIIVVALIVFSPKQLHQIVYYAGRYWHQLQSTLNKVKTNLDTSINPVESNSKRLTATKKIDVKKDG